MELFDEYEPHRELLMAVFVHVDRAARAAGHYADWDADDMDQISISAPRWTDEVVSVKVEDHEARALKLTMLTPNGVIAGEASFSNLSPALAAGAIISYLSID